MTSRTILSNFFEEQWTQNRPQYLLGLSRALSPTTFLEIAVYEIEAEDVYKDFRKDKDKFDNSSYSKDSAYFDPRNKKVIGKLQDEAGGTPRKEFVGLRSKMYSYMKDNGGGGKTAKGIKKNVIKKDIKHED